VDVALALKWPPSPLLRPWRVTGTDMLPSLLVMSKLLFVLLLCEHILPKIDLPFLPFVPWLDGLRELAGDELRYEYRLVFRAGFVTAGVLLWLNVRPRVVCVVLGLAVIFMMVGSKPLFRNHIYVVGCLFLLAGLSRPGRPPFLLYLQLSFIYLGAGLDKLFLDDWATGQFMDNFLSNARVNPVYLALVEVLPRMWVAMVVSYATVLSELVLGMAFLFRRTRPAAVWVAVLFHFGLYALLLGDTFGHFVEDLLLAFIVVIEWPPSPVAVVPTQGTAALARRVIAWVDWDRTFVVCEPGDPARPGVTAEPIRLDRRGWGYVLRRSGGFYVLLFAAYQVVYAWTPDPVPFVATSLVGVALMAFLAAPRPRAMRDG
jgi:hypothetical protein